MGNEYMDPNNPAFLREDTTISKYLKNFMLNNYKFMNSNEEIVKNFHKKKACCLGKNSVPFGLPSYNPSTKKVVTSLLKLNIFPDNNPNTLKTNCNEYTGEFDSTSKQHIPNQSCDVFYDKYCGNVYNERVKSYTNDSRFYGPYDIIPGDFKNTLSIGNEFQDCNCLNSAFQKVPNISVDTTNIPKDNDTLAQTLDKRCSDPGLSTNTYIKKYSKNEGGCFNKITVDGIVSDSKYPSIYANAIRKCTITPDDMKQIQDQLSVQKAALQQAQLDFQNQKALLDKQIIDLNNQRKSAEDSLTQLKIQKEQEKAALVAQFDKDLVDLRSKNKAETDKLLVDFEALKQKSIDQITAKFQQREDDYISKLKNIETNMNLLKVQEEKRTNDLLLEFQIMKQKSIDQITAQFQKREDDYRNKLITIEQKTKDLELNEEKRTAELIKEFQLLKQKSIDQISAQFQTRENDYLNKIKTIEADTAKLKADEQARVKSLMADLEKQRITMEQKLKELYNEREAYYKKTIDQLVIDNETKMKNLEAANAAKIESLNKDYALKMADVEKQKAELNKQYEDFKAQTQKNMDELRAKFNDTTIMYERQVNGLQQQITDKNNQIKKDLADLELKFNADVKNLSSENDNKKTLLIQQTNLQIEKYIDKYNNQKTSIDQDFEQQKAAKKAAFEQALVDQQNYYNKQIDSIKKGNSNINDQLAGMSADYKAALEQNQSQYSKMVSDYSAKKDAILKDYEKNKAEMESKFFNTLKELEDKKMATIKQKELETNAQINNLNKSVENVRDEVEKSSVIYKKQLVDLITGLEDQKISAIKIKAEETKSEINALNKTVEVIRADFEAKSAVYKKELQDLIVKLEDEKIAAIKKKEKETQDQINGMANLVTKTRQEVEDTSEMYKKQLRDLIEQLEDEKIKKISDYAAKIDNRIKELDDKYKEEEMRLLVRVEELKKEVISSENKLVVTKFSESEIPPVSNFYRNLSGVVSILLIICLIYILTRR